MRSVILAGALCLLTWGAQATCPAATAITTVPSTNTNFATADDGSGNCEAKTVVTNNPAPMQSSGGSVTANAGANLNTSALALSANQSTLKAGSTQSVAGDTSSVTQINPNQPQFTTPLNFNAAQFGGVNVVPNVCEANALLQAPVNLATSSTTQVIPATSGKKIYICAASFPPQQAAVTLAIVSGTGTNCGTIDGTTGTLGGGITAATGFSIGANGGWIAGTTAGPIGWTASNSDEVCIVPGSSAQISGMLIYVAQ